jgi:hypothetical protein
MTRYRGTSKGVSTPPLLVSKLARPQPARTTLI